MTTDPSSDVVERLRKLAQYCRIGCADEDDEATVNDAAATIERLSAELERVKARKEFWQRSAERNREQARVNHDCYLRLWAEHGGPELPSRLSNTADNG